MSASLNNGSLIRKDRPIILITIILLTVASSSCVLAGKTSKVRLIAKLTSQLREEKFEQLYEEAGDNLRRDVTKEEFVRRMKNAVAKMKAIDETLNFQRDTAMERIEQRDETFLIESIQRLGKGDKSALVYFTWDNEGKFFELSVWPQPGTSEEYRVPAVHWAVD